MRLNDDFSRPVIVNPENQDWIASPSIGVDRRMLFRIGHEKARATSIVRYAPGTTFPTHTHFGGEEILVLEGVFQDEHGDYTAGTYIRNPPGTAHAPFSKDGCIIFVRLGQFRNHDHASVVWRPEKRFETEDRNRAAADYLFDNADEKISLERWPKNISITRENSVGLEFFLTAGSIIFEGETLGPNSWGRLPSAQNLTCKTGPQGAEIWLRHAPLLFADVCPM